MIDTAKIMVDMDLVQILKPEYFTPNFNLSKLPFAQVSNDGFFECNQFIPSDTKGKNYKHFYFPRLKIKRIFTRWAKDEEGNRVAKFLNFLKIEFSIPKLLFGNNFEEVRTTDINQVVDTLIARLAIMGVMVNHDAILSAQVTGIHFGKNVVIGEYANCRTILREISKADITSRLELGMAEYRNDGYLVRFRSNSYELCFYDKLKDLEAAICKAKSRSVEQDQEIQKDMICKLKGKQILRMEFRMNNMKKFRSVCQKLDIKTKKSTELRSFEEVFDLEVSKKICNYYWSMLMNGMKASSLEVDDMQIIFEHLVHQRNWSESKVMSTIGAFYINNIFGSRYLKEYSDKKHADVKMLSKEINFTTPYAQKVMKRVQVALNNFNPIRFSELDEAHEGRKSYDENIALSNLFSL